MANAYEWKLPANHFDFAAFTHDAWTKDQAVNIGGLDGIVDYDVPENAEAPITTGKVHNVERVALSNITGSPVVGGNVYKTAAGYTTTSGTNLATYVVSNVDTEVAALVEV